MDLEFFWTKVPQKTWMSAVDLHQRNEWTVGPPDEPPPTMDNVKEELFFNKDGDRVVSKSPFGLADHC